ncbi:unnamed protein product [Natator depressus]
MRPSDRSAPSSAIPPPARLRSAPRPRPGLKHTPETSTGNPLRQQRGQLARGRTPQALAETPHSSCRALPGGEENKNGKLVMRIRSSSFITYSMLYFGMWLVNLEK